jgi:hypothetical protein
MVLCFLRFVKKAPTIDYPNVKKPKNSYITVKCIVPKTVHFALRKFLNQYPEFLIVLF